MIRLAVAAILALLIHAGLLWVKMPLSGPALKQPQSRSVSIDLVTFQKPVEKKEVQPKPKAVKFRPKPIPTGKPVVPAQPAPRPTVLEPTLEPVTEPQASPPDMKPEEAPLQTDAVETVEKDRDEETDDDRAAVQASVPRYDLNPPPHYPRAARRRLYQGTVILDVRVTVDGLVAQVRVAESSGHAILDKSAVKSVKKWHFTPARRGGQPFEMWVRVPVRFELQ